MRRCTLLLTLVLGLAAPSMGAVTEPWLLWSRDTHFRDHQPARQWRREQWVVRAGPFDTRHDCDRQLGADLNSAPQQLGDGYRVTAVLEVAVVARAQDGGGLRRRFMCLPASIAPPKP